MKCPVCDVTLSISSRESVEIDFCPQCRGVWLDRGELDKILDRAAGSPPPEAPTPAPAQSPRYDDRPRDDRPRDDRPRDDRPRDDRPRDDDRPRYDDRDRHGSGYKRKKKPGSFLEDIFDF